MKARILALLQLFRDKAPDRETHTWVMELVSDTTKWPEAHGLFTQIRRRSLAVTRDSARAIVPRDAGEIARLSQYSFEELCLKAVYNETESDGPFDTNSSFWLAGSAFKFARKVGVPIQSVVEIISPET